MQAVNLEKTQFVRERWRCRLYGRAIHRELYFDAKSGGLRVGGLGGGGGLGSGLEQGFQDGLGVHLRSGLGGGALTTGAGQGRGQTVLLWATSCAGIIT